MGLPGVFSRMADELSSLVVYDRLSVSLFNWKKSALTWAFISGIELSGMHVGDTLPVSPLHVKRNEGLDSTVDCPELRGTRHEAGLKSSLAVSLGTRPAGPIGFIELDHRSESTCSKMELELVIEAAERVTPRAENSLARKQQTRIAEVESKYRDLVDNSPDMIFSTDAQTGRIIDHNTAAKTVLGYTDDEMRELWAIDLYHPDSLDGAADVFRQLKDVGRVIDARTKFVRRDGSSLDVSINVAVVRDQAGNVVSAVSTVRDITEHLETEKLAARARQLNSENRELVRVNEARTEFLSRVSHELRNPLTAMLAFGDILSRNKGGTMTPPQLEQLHHIRRNGWRLDESIGDLLDVSRSELGNFVIEKQDFELTEVVRDTLESTISIFEQKQQNLSFEFEAGPVWVHGDEKRIAQVLKNLLSNASKYSPARSDIEVGMVSVADGVQIEVADNGIGIGRSDLARLFTPFFRVDSEQARKVEGTGLGLVIVKSIVECHGGHISIESTPGVGTIMRVFLPTIGSESTIGERSENDLQTEAGSVAAG